MRAIIRKIGSQTTVYSLNFNNIINLSDFNTALLGGQRGYPGIRARLNQRSFQYASSIVGDLLNSEIKKARIPPISQCIPQVSRTVSCLRLCHAGEGKKRERERDGQASSVVSNKATGSGSVRRIFGGGAGALRFFGAGGCKPLVYCNY